MKFPVILLCSAALSGVVFAEPAAPDRSASTVTLDEISVKNLGIETVEAAETDFAETVFALGRIEVLPGKKGVVSSRVAGRAQSVIALPDMKCEQGDELVWLESRQPGDPPPVLRLDAPIAGTIAKVNIAPGQPIAPGESLVEIVDLETVEAAAAVPEHLAGALRKGMKARVKAAAFPDKIFEAELAHLGVEADGDAGTIEAAFHLQNPEELLRPGMRAEFSITVSERQGVMSIPVAALQGDGASRFVFIRDYELKNAFVKTPVVLGARNEEFVEVKEGLLPGDEVVTRGGYSLVHAGTGSVSLKEALDAAHGHPHNEDGTEMSAEQLAANKGGGGHDHDHADAGAFSAPLTKFFAAATAVLFALLVTSVVTRRQPQPR